MPPSLAPPDIFRDQLALKYPGYGHALWEPNPGGLHNAVEVGDVGYILHGKFMRLFNALRPADHPSHEKSELPESHEPLKPKIDDYINSCTLGPKNFCSSGVMESTTHAHGVAETSALGPGGLVELSFSCERKRGAALLLPVRVQSEDTDAKGEFAEWMVGHIDDCFSFAKGRHPEIKKMEDIILVTGHHRAKSWANIAFIESPGPGRTGPMQVSLRVAFLRVFPAMLASIGSFPANLVTGWS
ncbi:hypothetical protein EI94DRAFT_217613 [Lactarius quietus]|nr:hypothetical protein EI94DRAFT_217613 [Lactarius quietus]